MSEQCPRCDGTGNELLSMYRRCSLCGGSGRLVATTPPTDKDET